MKTSGKSRPRGVEQFGKHRTSPHQKLSQDTCRASTANQGPILCPNLGCTKKCHRMRATNLSSSPAPTFALDSPAIRNFNFGWSEVQHHKVLPCTKWFWALRRRGLHRCALRPLLCRWALCRCALRLWRALQNLHTLCYVPELIVWLSCPWITWWYCLWLLLLPAQSRTPVTQKPYNNVHSCLCAKDERKVRFNNIVISSQKSKDTPAGGWSHELALKHSTVLQKHLRIKVKMFAVEQRLRTLNRYDGANCSSTSGGIFRSICTSVPLRYGSAFLAILTPQLQMSITWRYH